MKSLVSSGVGYKGIMISLVLILLGMTCVFADHSSYVKAERLDGMNLVIDLDHFNQLGIGMNYSEVVKVLGEPTLFFHYVPDQQSDVYIWDFHASFSDMESYAVILRNDRVVSTHYTGKYFNIGYGSDLSVADILDISNQLAQGRFQSQNNSLAAISKEISLQPKTAFELIEFDMEYSDVVDLLGKPRMQTCAEPSTKYVWNIGETIISVRFTDGKVAAKDLNTKDYRVKLSLAKTT